MELIGVKGKCQKLTEMYDFCRKCRDDAREAVTTWFVFGCSVSVSVSVSVSKRSKNETYSYYSFSSYCIVWNPFFVLIYNLSNYFRPSVDVNRTVLFRRELQKIFYFFKLVSASAFKGFNFLIIFILFWSWRTCRLWAFHFHTWDMF